MLHPVLDCHHGNILLQYGEFVLENITLLMNVQYKCKVISHVLYEFFFNDDQA